MTEYQGQRPSLLDATQLLTLGGWPQSSRARRPVPPYQVILGHALDDPRLGRRLAAADLACVQPAVVGMGAGEVAAGDVGLAGAAAAGLACASAVVVTAPAELPFSQADQDSCQ